MNEKVKFLNNEVFDIVPGGFMATEDSVKIVMLPGNKTLSEIDTLTDDESNTSRLELLSADGSALDIRKGYVFQTECRKVKDYAIGREEYQEGVDPDGNPFTAYRDITKTIIMVTLKKSDIRHEMNDIKETVDMLVIKSLEV